MDKVGVPRIVHRGPFFRSCEPFSQILTPYPCSISVSSVATFFLPVAVVKGTIRDHSVSDLAMLV